MQPHQDLAGLIKQIYGLTDEIIDHVLTRAPEANIAVLRLGKDLLEDGLTLKQVAIHVEQLLADLPKPAMDLAARRFDELISQELGFVVTVTPEDALPPAITEGCEMPMVSSLAEATALLMGFVCYVLRHVEEGPVRRSAIELCRLWLPVVLSRQLRSD